MSHFSEIKTNLKNKKILKKALEALGYSLVEEENGVEVRGFFGATQKAEFKALTRTHYDIGFVLNQDGNYDVVADWELMPKVSLIEKDQFLREVKREYAKQTVLLLAQEKGYEVQMTENEENQTLQMVVTQW